MRTNICSLICAIAVQAVVLVSPAHAEIAIKPRVPESSVVINGEAARNRAVEIAQTMMAKVNSASKLQEFVGKTSGEPPLAYLSSEARKRFVSSLTFNENGLTGFRYDDIEAELTFSEAYELLSVFGAQSRIFSMDLAVSSEQDAKLLAVVSRSVFQTKEDHVGYKCVDRFNCYQTMSYICMSGCSPIMTP
jgi:hypothetical protein